jgi:hypothetical protein
MKKVGSSQINLKSTVIKNNENSSDSKLINSEESKISKKKKSEDSKVESQKQTEKINLTTTGQLIDDKEKSELKSEEKSNRSIIKKKKEENLEKKKEEENNSKLEDSKVNESDMTSSIANSENISDDEIANPRKSQMDKAYYLANLAMKINDADEAVRYSDEMAILNEEPLTRDQRRVFCGCNYLYIEKLRSGLLYLNKLLITEQTGKRMINEIKDLKEKIILKRCEHVIRIINENLLTKKIEPEVMALYLKMKGDYYRYMAEISKGNLLYVNKQNAFHFYNEAKDIVKDFDDLNPTKLNISLNYSVFLNEVLNKRINSFFYAKEALYNALKSLKNCSEDELTSEDMKDTLMIIEILNRNVEDWYKEEVGDIFEDEKKAKKKEEEEKEKKKKKHKKHKEEEKEENNKDKDKDNDELIDTSSKRFKPRKSISGNVPEIPNLNLGSSMVNPNSSHHLNPNQLGKSIINVKNNF